MIKKREDIVLLFLTRAKRLFFFLPHQEMKEAERGFDRGCPGLLHLRLGSTTGNSANKAPARDAQGSDWQAFKGIPQPECNVSQCSLWPKLSSGRISAKIKGDDGDDDDDPSSKKRRFSEEVARIKHGATILDQKQQMRFFLFLFLFFLTCLNK